MQNRQRHRGRQPNDAKLFDTIALVQLQKALFDLSWLLSRGYTETSALKIVGDRYELRKRQRIALRRCACSDQQKEHRKATRQQSVQGEDVAIDGFNSIITFEAMLSAGPIFIGRDEVRRDIASVHGSYRRVEETEPAIDAIEFLLRPAKSVTWFLDRPVSNSGSLAQRLRDRADASQLPWTVHVVNNPDRELVAMDHCIAATTDSWILDNARRWIDLGSLFRANDLWLLDLREAGSE